MSDNLFNKWIPVQTVDPMKRKPKEWANIYHIQLLEVVDGLWNEYEWAYNLSELKYLPLPDKNEKGEILDTFDTASEMELRAMELKRDIYLGASIGEAHLLDTKKKYIETDWIRHKLNLL